LSQLGRRYGIALVESMIKISAIPVVDYVLGHSKALRLANLLAQKAGIPIYNKNQEDQKAGIPIYNKNQEEDQKNELEQKKVQDKENTASKEKLPKLVSIAK